MARWGSLNIALTAWRDAYRALFAKYGITRGTESDGALADSNHGSASQHQQDSDGTVDANDMDVNVLGSSNPTGTAAERRIIEAMKLDFENDPHGRSQLWISYREIANRDVRDWAERAYTGPSPHDHHVHWESRQSREDDGRAWPMPRTEAAIRNELGLDDLPMNQADFNKLMNGWAATPEGRAALNAWDDTFGSTSAGERLAKVEALGPKVDALAGQLDELLSRVPDNTPAQRLDK